jgi:plastocyanin
MLARRSAAAALVAITGVSLGACTRQAAVNREGHSGSTTASAVNGLQRVTVQANDSYRFDPSTITVHPGRVEIDLMNVGKGAPHDWSLDVVKAITGLAPAGQTRSVVFTAPAPGTYTFVCTIHRKQGQTGKLVVLGE